MKKLMIAAALVCAVCSVNAAQFLWYGEDQVIAGYEGGSGAGASGDGYLISAATLGYSSAQDILTSWAAGTVADLSGITGKAYALDDEAGYSNPVLDGGSFEAQTPSGLTLNTGDYYALFVTTDETSGDTWAYLSSAVTVDSIDLYGVTEVVFENDGGRSAAGTGWYTQAVPEPTSGLLLLLGVAGLALRRRRA